MPSRPLSPFPAAAIISAVARENLGDLLTHPGAATIGVYYLARRHQVCNTPALAHLLSTSLPFPCMQLKSPRALPLVPAARLPACYCLI
jgi:hypothetical protein